MKLGKIDLKYIKANVDCSPLAKVRSVCVFHPTGISTK